MCNPELLCSGRARLASREHDGLLCVLTSFSRPVIYGITPGGTKIAHIRGNRRDLSGNTRWARCCQMELAKQTRPDLPTFSS